MLSEFKNLTAGIAPLRASSMDHIHKRFEESVGQVKQAMIELLAHVKRFPAVEVRGYDNGFSLYTVSVSGRSRECGHFGVNADNRIVVYQHGEVFDPRGIFSQHLPSSKRHKYGHIAGTPAEVDYVKRIFKQSFRRLSDA